MTSYPLHREADVVLRDGSTVHVRPARPADAPEVERLLKGLSDRSRWLRFFSGYPDLTKAVQWATEVDYERRYGLVATSGADGRVVGHAGFERQPDHPDRAEVALEIVDALQGKGLGTILLGQLAEAANQLGIQVLDAEVLAENHQMVKVFRDCGFPVRTHSLSGYLLIEFPTSMSPEALERFERREQLAATAAMRAFFEPRAVAVIGASRRRGTVSGELFHNLLAAGFNGPVYPVNPKASVVQSVVAYKSVLDVPGPVDLAVLALPAPSVVEAAGDCAAKGVRAIVVISAGFAETGPEGAQRQRELLAVCRAAGMRLIGPNCLGIVNTDAEVRLDATFGPIVPLPGRVGFLSQSGALGLAIIDYANALGLGLSSFVSVGNKADISSNDLLSFWEQDERTNLVLLYLESFGNPRKFARIARRVARTKPVLAVKSGRSAAGARATSSHTGALLAASDVTVDALFDQAGVIRTDSLAELFDVASLLANQPIPAGRRVGIVTNAGGPGIMCADACEAGGLEVVELSPRLQASLAEELPPEAAVANPVDMLASAPPEHYRRTVELVAASGEVDAVIAIFIPPLPADTDAVVQAVHDATARARSVPVLNVVMSSADPPLEDGDGPRLPRYRFPEDAAHALVRAVEYGAWRQRPEGQVPELPDARRDEAAALLAAALADGTGPRWLSPEEVARLLGCYGIPTAEWRLAGSPEEAAAAANELGGPVALKAVAPRLVHKTEAGAVRLGLASAEAVQTAAAEMSAAVAAEGYTVDGFLVQRMVGQGVEVLVGVVHDASFGPVIACGAGGTAVELLKDVAVRITPLTDLDAAEMVRSLATYPLLDGYRGAPRADVAALEDLLLRVSALVEAHPAIAEVDCNPVKVLPDGVVVVDARVRVEAATLPLPLAARRR
ncbi:MAG TPA: GNAT family N-acetyltransferase [Actinomycetota bacterium]|jgi:acetyl coenzyme A synthetase (ADP forming)-like protein|nr:GNAT family N-acetyltransferase [Actinomycetota bacterium]